MGKRISVWKVVPIALVILLTTQCSPSPISVDPAPISTQTAEMVTQTPPIENTKAPEETKKSSESVSQESTREPSEGFPPGWKTISNDQYGFEFAYPPDWELCTRTEFSDVLCRRGDSGGPSFPVFYITVIPEGYLNADAAAYNFISSEKLDSLSNLPVGGSFAAELIPDYSTFTRLEDTTIHGKDATVIENDRVWGGTNANTKDRRVILIMEDNTMMLGTYYTSQSELEDFQAVLRTFRWKP
jgi:hypothetical protein